MPQKTEAEQFLEQAAIPVTPDPAAPAASTEPEMVYEGDEETPPVTPTEPTPTPQKEEVNWEQKLADMQGKVDAVTQENQDLKYRQYDQVDPPAPAETPTTGIPDPYAEPAAFEAYIEAKSTKKAEEISQPLMDRLKGVEMIQGQNLWEQGVKDCKTQFPGFDIVKEGANLQKLMQAKGVSMLEAKKLIEFDKMQEQLVQLQSGVTERTNVPPTTTTTAATRTVEERQTILLPKLTQDEKEYAAKRGKSEKEFSVMKYKSTQARGQMPE